MAGYMTDEQKAARMTEICRRRRNGESFETMGRAMGISKEYLRAWFAGERTKSQLVAKKTTQRACLCCRVAFASEGAHHRLCGYCAGRAHTLSPMTPDPGGDTGRQKVARAGK